MCRSPWAAIHPDRSVNSLAQAMNPRFDSLYAGFSLFSFARCEGSYQQSSERPDGNLVSMGDRFWQAGNR